MEMVTIPREVHMALLKDQEILRQVLRSLTLVTEPILQQREGHLNFVIGVHGYWAPQASFPTDPMRYSRLEDRY